MTHAQRLKWLNDDGNEGKYKIATKLKPRRDYCTTRVKQTRRHVKNFLEEQRNKSDL